MLPRLNADAVGTCRDTGEFPQDFNRPFRAIDAENIAIAHHLPNLWAAGAGL
jgi:hypothetical protein